MDKHSTTVTIVLLPFKTFYRDKSANPAFIYGSRDPFPVYANRLLHRPLK